MRQFIFPLQDASIYSEFPNLNTGFDEMLEVGKTGVTNEKVRALVQFDLSSLGEIPSGSKFDLQLYVANAENLKNKQAVHVNPIAESWEGGSGYFAQSIIQDTDGVTWTLRQSGSSWASGSAGNTTNPTSSSVNLTNPLGDVTVDVTDIVMEWISGSANNGFAVSFPSASEADGKNKGKIQFFSNETHTIYRPALIMKWDDQVHLTGSLSGSPAVGLTCSPATLRSTYRVGEVARVDVAVRELSPTKTFANAFTMFDGRKSLPKTAYFSIVDELSGTTIIPFDEYSKISCDANGAYFTFRVENMYPQRYYRVKIKVDHDGLSEIFDSGYIFKVAN